MRAMKTGTQKRGGNDDAQETCRIPLALAFGTLPFAAQAADLTFFHTWSNESEIAALNTILEPFEARRATRSSTASVPHETAGESPLTSLIVAGTPPNLFIAADAGTFRDLRDKGLGQEVGTLFDKIGATKAFPETVLRRSRSTARSARFRSPCTSTAWSTTT